MNQEKQKKKKIRNRIGRERVYHYLLMSLGFLALTSLAYFTIDFNKIGSQDSFEASAISLPEDNYFEEFFGPRIEASSVKKEATVQAKSIISIEFNENSDKVLYQENENNRLPIASLTKLMTALIVLDNYDLSQKITVSPSAMQQIGEQGGLKEGEALSVKDLLYIMLIDSSNRASYSLAQAIGHGSFVWMMNQKALELGLFDTYFYDSSGLDDRSYSSAKDIAALSRHLFLNYPLFGEIVGISQMDLYLEGGIFHHKLENTNKLLLEGMGVVGGKTGWTDIARGCFMVIQKTDDKSYVFHVIIGAEDRMTEIKKLMNKVKDNLLIQDNQPVAGQL